MDTIERGVLRDTTKPTDEEAGLSATKERYGSHSDDDTREVLRDGEQIQFNAFKTRSCGNQLTIVATDSAPPPPFKGLSFLDRFLVVWIILAMAIGIILANLVPETGPALQRGTFVGVSAPIAVGLLVM